MALAHEGAVGHQPAAKEVEQPGALQERSFARGRDLHRGRYIFLAAGIRTCTSIIKLLGWAVSRITSQRLLGARPLVAKVRGRTSRGEVMSREGRESRGTWQVCESRSATRTATCCERLPSRGGARSSVACTMERGPVARSTRGTRSPWRREVREGHVDHSNVS